MRVGSGAGDDVRALGVTLDEGRATVDIACADGWRRLRALTVPGRAAADDLLLAVALIWRGGLDH